MKNARVWQIRFSNYACGALTLATSLLVGRGVLALYQIVQAHGLHAWPASRYLAFPLAFLAIDFIYYWQHRAEHSIGALWALHAVHHQAEICDASVSLRTSLFNPLTVLGIHLVLAAIGLPFEIYFPVYLVHFALIFVMHSRTPKWVDRAGLVFNSPYVHRGHHSNAPHLRGKNFAGVLVIWDRLFGTWEANCDVQGYGIGRAETPLNAIEANAGPLLAWVAATRKSG